MGTPQELTPFDSANRSLHAGILQVGVHDRIEDGRSIVILSGEATIEFNDDASLAQVAAGSLCTMYPHANTSWTVTETLEYIIVTEPSIVYKPRANPVNAVGAERGFIKPFRPRRRVS